MSIATRPATFAADRPALAVSNVRLAQVLAISRLDNDASAVPIAGGGGGRAEV